MEFVLAGPHHARRSSRAALADLGCRALRSERRGRHVVYLKGQEEIAALLRLVGANRGVLELETHRVGRDVRSRLNRLLNAEEANLARTVRAAGRQLAAIARLERRGRLAAPGRPRCARPPPHGAACRTRISIRLPSALGVSRSAVNHRLRRLVELASDEED